MLSFEFYSNVIHLTLIDDKIFSDMNYNSQGRSLLESQFSPRQAEKSWFMDREKSRKIRACKSNGPNTVGDLNPHPHGVGDPSLPQHVINNKINNRFVLLNQGYLKKRLWMIFIFY